MIAAPAPATTAATVARRRGSAVEEDRAGLDFATAFQHVVPVGEQTEREREKFLNDFLRENGISFQDHIRNNQQAQRNLSFGGRNYHQTMTNNALSEKSARDPGFREWLETKMSSSGRF